jgi:hypothetical protein
MSHILQFVDVIGKYATDWEGKSLPSRRTWTGRFSSHSGTQVWMHSTLPGADSSDFQVFKHYHTQPNWFNAEFSGRMITVTQELKYDYHSGMWYYTNTVTPA